MASSWKWLIEDVRGKVAAVKSKSRPTIAELKICLVECEDVLGKLDDSLERGERSVAEAVSAKQAEERYARIARWLANTLPLDAFTVPMYVELESMNGSHEFVQIIKDRLAKKDTGGK